MERAWEKKMIEQKVQHLEEVIASQNNKMEQLHNELVAAQEQMHGMA
jgi:uncharacterized coiled-coil protein SlyX